MVAIVRDCRRLAKSLTDEEPPAVVDEKSDRICQQGLGGNDFHLQTGGNLETADGLLGFFGGGSDSGLLRVQEVITQGERAKRQTQENRVATRPVHGTFCRHGGGAAK